MAMDVGKTIIDVACSCCCSCRTARLENDDKSVSEFKGHCFRVEDGAEEYMPLDTYKEYSANEYFAEVNYSVKYLPNCTIILPLKLNTYHMNSATPLAIEAIHLFNQHNMKNFEFVRLLNLNGEEGKDSGMIYYITFDAMDAAEAEGQPITFKAMVFTYAGFGWKPQIYKCGTDHELKTHTTRGCWMGPLVKDDSELKNEGTPFFPDEEEDEELMPFDKFKEYSASEFFSYVNYCCKKFKSFSMMMPLKQNSDHRKSATALSIEAIHKFNQQNNKNFEFVMLLILNGEKKINGMTYYITFEAMDAAESEGQPITFQAMVITWEWDESIRGPEIRFCRMKQGY